MKPTSQADKAKWSGFSSNVLKSIYTSLDSSDIIPAINPFNPANNLS
jgi:hypothetical protein